MLKTIISNQNVIFLKNLSNITNITKTNLFINILTKPTYPNPKYSYLSFNKFQTKNILTTLKYSYSFINKNSTLN